MNSLAEENYLKALYKLGGKSGDVQTNALAEELNTKASSVTDMMKKLAEKKLVNYEPYKGVSLSKEGFKVAIYIVRKHRLWEVFLVEKLAFKWDEVHEIAEQLEHIQSSELIEKLDEFLDFPKFDPHGDPIPDKDGSVYQHLEITLSQLEKKEKGIVVGVKEHSKAYLNYLDNLNLVLGAEVFVEDKVEFDSSMKVRINKNDVATISNQATKNLYIKKI
ncbi:MAG: metal-dependent transcriptional regulator [Flavobacteriales bacterium]|nr:metal-dependent transcriptional regulator [Flavobacteriales bacterium]MBX2958359.1 metal-dependent transcriptional regulator [Flavobacteriales bacterium]MCL4856304.1 metal-dependent transcriptional regulator [Flavobacteriales bacterium]HRN41647.1 metal-dependent transcriptional regulator [Vicingus sp.]